MCRIQLKLWPFLSDVCLFGQNLVGLPWQRPLDTCYHKCRLWICRPRKPPVISNQILVLSRRNAFISIFSPTIGCHGNAVLYIMYRRIVSEFADS